MITTVEAQAFIDGGVAVCDARVCQSPCEARAVMVVEMNLTGHPDGEDRVRLAACAEDGALWLGMPDHAGQRVEMPLWG